MPEIRPLDPHVADLIAAGEVVERPASVVKELAENAIDAGAHSVTVEIQNGGMTLIRVADDGCGIPWDQCETAFLRHATSKLRVADDLAAIGTLGFRGEALAAIAAVSTVELFTRTAEEPLGTALVLEGGQVLSKEQVGCPLGTTLLVRDLFHNTPARLKFMRRDAAEGAAVFAVIQRLALSHPEVAFKFLRDGRQELLSPGDGALGSALYAVFGRDIALGFTPVRGSGEGVTVSGYATLPACCRGSRSYEHFFVNGRQIKSKLLAAAVERAYENQKMVGRFPGCVLEISLSPADVDVNVHPAKTEVKFLYERKVFDAVHYAVLSALTAGDRRPDLTLDAPEGPAMPAEERPAPRPGASLKVSSPTFTRAAAGAPRLAEAVQPGLLRPAPHRIGDRNVDNSVENVEKHRRMTEKPPPGMSDPRPTPPEPIAPAAAPVERPPASLLPDDGPAWRLAGEVLDTYLIVEQGDEILLIDKHAAHERMQFDRMKEAGYRPMAQALLAPVVFTPAPEEGAALLAHADLLRAFGFACEDFGDGAVAVREIPFDLAPGETESALCEIAETLRTGGTLDPDAARDAVLHTVACKSAIKGGQRNSPEELRIVAEAVVSGRVRYCPHGRPVAITLTRAQLEKRFGRA